MVWICSCDVQDAKKALPSGDSPGFNRKECWGETSVHFFLPESCTATFPIGSQCKLVNGLGLLGLDNVDADDVDDDDASSSDSPPGDDDPAAINNGTVVTAGNN